VLRAIDYIGADIVVEIRDRFENPSIRGFVLNSNDACTLIRQFDAFLPDGYAILRTLDIAIMGPSDPCKWFRCRELAPALVSV
jgi:hypothetical protein